MTEGKNADYPVKALPGALDHIRKSVEFIRADQTTPDTRLADTVMDFNPASVRSLTQLMEAGLYIQHPGWAKTSPAQDGSLHCRLRYFDPVRQRAGIPEDVAALIDTMTADHVTVSLINLNPTIPRRVIVQGGAYGEHRITTVANVEAVQQVNERSFEVELAPGAGARLTVGMDRSANQPTLALPWES